MALNAPYTSTKDLPEKIGLFPLQGALLLPRVEMPLQIFEPRYVALIDSAMNAGRLIGLVQPAFDGVPGITNPQLTQIGCLGRITGLHETGDARYFLTLTGVARYHIVEELNVDTPFRQARVSYEAFKTDLEPGEGESVVDRRKLLETFERYLDANHMEADWRSINDAPNEALVNALSMLAPYGPREKQALLEAKDLRDRAEMLIAMTELNLAQSGPASGELLN